MRLLIRTFDFVLAVIPGMITGKNGGAESPLSGAVACVRALSLCKEDKP